MISTTNFCWERKEAGIKKKYPGRKYSNLSRQALPIVACAGVTDRRSLRTSHVTVLASAAVPATPPGRRTAWTELPSLDHFRVRNFLRRHWSGRIDQAAEVAPAAPVAYTIPASSSRASVQGTALAAGGTSREVIAVRHRHWKRLWRQKF